MSERKKKKRFRQPIDHCTFVDSGNVDSNTNLIHLPDEHNRLDESPQKNLIIPSQVFDYASALCIATAITATFFAVFFKVGRLSKALPNFPWETHLYFFCFLFMQTAKLAVTGGLAALVIWNLLKEHRVNPIVKWSLTAWAAFLSVLIYVSPNLWTLQGWTQPYQIFITFFPGLFGGLLSIGVLQYKQRLHLISNKDSLKQIDQSPNSEIRLQ